jgi:transcriptional regulator with XRE-family HTH domain
MQRFGDKLKYLRKKSDFTLVQLGELLGVHNTYVSQLETGKRIPNAEMILKIADIFGVSCDQLMRDELSFEGQ